MDRAFKLTLSLQLPPPLTFRNEYCRITTIIIIVVAALDTRRGPLGLESGLGVLLSRPGSSLVVFLAAG